VTVSDAATTWSLLRMNFDSDAPRRRIVKTYGAIDGGNQTFERPDEDLVVPAK
jgi:hypothetical protein